MKQALGKVDKIEEKVIESVINSVSQSVIPFFNFFSLIQLSTNLQMKILCDNALKFFRSHTPRKFQKWCVNTCRSKQGATSESRLVTVNMKKLLSCKGRTRKPSWLRRLLKLINNLLANHWTSTWFPGLQPSSRKEYSCSLAPAPRPWSVQRRKMRVTEMKNSLTEGIDVASNTGIARLLRQSDAQVFSGWGGLPGINDEEVHCLPLNLLLFLNGFFPVWAFLLMP